MQKTIGLILFFVLFISCDMEKHPATSGEKKPQDPDKFVMTGHIVEKDFIKKNGRKAGFSELYFRASIQDYFIKFCESGITRSDLDPFVDKVVSIEAEVIKGNWDICPGDPQEMQSRIGHYLVVKKLL
jgi:hypothetical protein